MVQEALGACEEYGVSCTIETFQSGLNFLQTNYDEEDRIDTEISLQKLMFQKNCMLHDVKPSMQLDDGKNEAPRSNSLNMLLLNLLEVNITIEMNKITRENSLGLENYLKEKKERRIKIYRASRKKAKLFIEKKMSEYETARSILDTNHLIREGNNINERLFQSDRRSKIIKLQRCAKNHLNTFEFYCFCSLLGVMIVLYCIFAMPIKGSMGIMGKGSSLIDSFLNGYNIFRPLNLINFIVQNCRLESESGLCYIYFRVTVRVRVTL